MTKGEVNARVEVVLFLISVRKLHDVTMKDLKKRIGQQEPFVGADEIELQTGIRSSILRKAIKGCTFVTAKTGKKGGYRLSIAPDSLWPKAKKILDSNKGKPPQRWVRKVPLTMADLIGDMLCEQVLGMFTSDTFSTSLRAVILKSLEATVLYTFDVSIYAHNYL